MLLNLNWMHINEIENKITDVMLYNNICSEFVCHSVKLLRLCLKLSEQKRIWLPKNEIEFLKMKLSEWKWNRVSKN